MFLLKKDKKEEEMKKKPHRKREAVNEKWILDTLDLKVDGKEVKLTSVA
jgi:hypothetical protein